MVMGYVIIGILGMVIGYMVGWSHAFNAWDMDFFFEFVTLTVLGIFILSFEF